MRRSLALSSLSIAVIAACSRSTVVSSPAGTSTAPTGAVSTTAAITPADLRRRVFIFADDSMMGREVGTPYNDKGTAYIEREVRRLGLRPAGDNGTFFQKVPVMMSLPQASGVLSSGSDQFRVGTDFWARDNRAFGVPTPSVDGAQVVFGGRLGDTSTMISPDRTAGKFVVMTVPMVNGKPQWMNTRQPLTIFYRNAAAVAVVALESITEPERQQYFAPELVYAGVKGDPFTNFMYITTAMAEKVMGAPLAGLTKGAAGKTIRGNIVYGGEQLPGRNVVAILQGSDATLRNEYVAIGAHNDHVGFNEAPVDHDSLRAFNSVVKPMGADNPDRPVTAAETQRIRTILDSLRKIRPARKDSIFNGADDDGSGSMSVLEIAEAFASAATKPKRSIIFVWHTGEEHGLWGSDHFTQNPTVPREAIVAQLNMDMVGRGGANDIAGGGPGYAQLIGSRRLSTELGDIIDSVGAKQPTPFKFDYSFDANGHPSQYYCRSDHYNYARYGIPIAFISTGGHRDYHQQTDEPQYEDYDQMSRVAKLYFDVASVVANRPNRVKVDKPKPANPFGQCQQ